jgi:hypothetical protein
MCSQECKYSVARAQFMFAAYQHTWPQKYLTVTYLPPFSLPKYMVQKVLLGKFVSS